MTEIIEGLGRSERERIGALREGGRFFWIDLAVDDTSRDDLGAALGIPEPALERLFDFGESVAAGRQFYADGRQVAFALSCYLESSSPAGGSPYRLHPVVVHVLVTGDYVLTMHEDHVSLPRLLAPDMAEGRSDQYVVYTVVDSMVATAFDALDEAEQALERLGLTAAEGRVGRAPMAALRAINSRLSGMRRRVGPQRGLAERVSVEIGRVEGLEADDEHYFERIVEQLNRLVDGIDAAADALAQGIDLRLNETTYWLTVVATIFLPLTFITGFFGMNFGWMVEQIDTALAFWLLGVGSLLVGVALIWRLVVRGSPAQAEQDRAEGAQ
jgi:magnesium transporter